MRKGSAHQRGNLVVLNHGFHFTNCGVWLCLCVLVDGLNHNFLIPKICPACLIYFLHSKLCGIHLLGSQRGTFSRHRINNS